MVFFIPPPDETASLLYRLGVSRTLHLDTARGFLPALAHGWPSNALRLPVPVANFPGLWYGKTNLYAALAHPGAGRGGRNHGGRDLFPV